MPARGGEPAEQRVAAFLLRQMKALRIVFPREALDLVGGEGEGADLAPAADMDVLEEPHQRWPSRRLMMIGEIISHSTSPAALRATPLKVTMPVSGRLRDTRASVTSTSSVMSSPGRKRRHPAQFVDAGRAERSGAADEAVEHHPHHDRAEMPARARQPLQHGLGRGLLVEMHRLRVVLAGKLQNLLARDVARAEGAEAADRKIFESEGHSVRGLRLGRSDCGRTLRQSQPVRPHGFRYFVEALCGRADLDET